MVFLVASLTFILWRTDRHHTDHGTGKNCVTYLLRYLIQVSQIGR